MYSETFVYRSKMLLLYLPHIQRLNVLVKKVTWAQLSVTCLYFNAPSFTDCTTVLRSWVVTLSGSGQDSSTTFSRTLRPVSEISPTSIN